MAPTLSETIEFRRPPGLPGVEVLRADNCGRAWRVFHQTYSVCALLDLSGGEAEWSYRGKLHSCKAGGLMLIEPGEVHASHEGRPGAFRALFIAPSLIENAATELGMATRQPHLKQAFTTDPDLFLAFTRFHATLQTASSTLERESRLAVCIRRLLRQCSETGSPDFKQPDRSIMRGARDFLREHYSRSNTLDDLVAATDLSRYHLVRAFTKEFGLPPHAYQIHVQAAHARRLLAADEPPALVAAQVGFADQSHFGRHFKRIYGVTPGQYRLESRAR